MKLRVGINTKEALKRGKTYEGNQYIDLSDEHLAAMSQEERDLLSILVGRLDGEIGVREYSSIDSEDYTPKAANFFACFVEPTIDALRSYLAKIWLNISAQKSKYEKQKQEETDKNEKLILEALADHKKMIRYDHQRYDIDGVSHYENTPSMLSPTYHSWMSDPRLYEAKTTMELYCNEKELEIRMRLVESVAKRKAEALKTAEAKIIDRDKWIVEHGSDRLKLALETGLVDTIEKSYFEERLTHDRPGWRLERESDRVKKIIEPTAIALEVYASNKKTIDCELIWLVSLSYRCEALLSTWMENRIILEIGEGRFIDDEEY